MTVRQNKKTFGTFKLTRKAPFVPPHVCKKCPFREESLAEYKEAVEFEKQLQTINKNK